jgi:DNA-binding transcriptional LysR family regulator
VPCSIKRQTRSVQHTCAATESMPGDRDPTDLDPAPAPATTNYHAAGSSHRGVSPGTTILTMVRTRQPICSDHQMIYRAAAAGIGTAFMPRRADAEAEAR